MYSFTELVGGVKFTVYFFGTFAGHFQPFTPVDPMEFDAVHGAIEKYGSSVHYRAWYSDTAEGSRLDRLYKYAVLGRRMELEDQISNVPGVYYHRLEKSGAKWQVKELITPEVAINQAHYLRYEINNEGNLHSSHYIYSAMFNSYLYTYKDNGAYDKAEIGGERMPTEIPDL